MNKSECFSLGLFVGVIGFIIIQSFTTRDTPRAIDVYRNKTTLEITYRDGIPVDSAVVFKKNLK